VVYILLLADHARRGVTRGKLNAMDLPFITPLNESYFRLFVTVIWVVLIKNKIQV